VIGHANEVGTVSSSTASLHDTPTAGDTRACSDSAKLLRDPLNTLTTGRDDARFGLHGVQIETVEGLHGLRAPDGSLSCAANVYSVEYLRSTTVSFDVAMSLINECDVCCIVAGSSLSSWSDLIFRRSDDNVCAPHRRINAESDSPVVEDESATKGTRMSDGDTSLRVSPSAYRT